MSITAGDGGGQVFILYRYPIWLQVTVVDKSLSYIPYDSAVDGGGQVFILYRYLSFDSAGDGGGQVSILYRYLDSAGDGGGQVFI